MKNFKYDKKLIFKILKNKNFNPLDSQIWIQKIILEEKFNKTNF
jgi:hypothetical protein